MEELDHYSRRDFSGQRATGIGLAAAALGLAVLVPVVGIWGVNAASKARSVGAMAGIAANTAALGALNNTVAANRTAADASILAERTSREGWQNYNQPSIKSYIDVQATPSASSVSNATAEALALAAAINNGGLGSAVGTESFLKVARYAAPQPCGCDTTPCGCGN